MKKQEDPVEIFAGNNWQASLLKTILEDLEIEAFLKDEIMGTMNPWWTDAGGAGPIKVYVALKDEERARQVVEDYLKKVNED